MSFTIEYAAYVNSFVWLTILVVLSSLILIWLSAKNQDHYSLEDANSHAEDFGGVIAESHGPVTTFLYVIYFILLVWTIAYFAAHWSEFGNSSNTSSNMFGINTGKLMSISFDLQIIAVCLINIGFFSLLLGKSIKEKFKKHDIISTSAYVLVALSVPYMIYFTRTRIVSQSVSPLVLIHSLIGIMILIMGFIFVINRRDWKLKRNWKRKSNMQILLILWVVNFIIGAYMHLFLI
ncbi:hypothetical protein Metho_0516 [Methanomethylovorans hollandica DSM 15978]|uniref:Uncharacterized protein n=1 Tax=Methanomethylovorans hollandica (strain DSM 15978 / NBRC 107637 / DMS1) TaxID=867904 RepID=L0KXK1_METHD|nr:hypothetical protein [Methanomethylovorans hollandica]AGB48783.1 hypothetical protein Metho_0516 [Methanomethylovorans hollandica DSM 15978]